MAHHALDALQADRDAVLGICGGLDAESFDAPSGCEGWTVKDVVTHMGVLFQMVVDPSALIDTGGQPTERAQDRLVDSRRPRTAEAVIADYERVGAIAIERLAGLVGQDFELDLGDLGTYPADLLVNAYAMDHYIHIRADLHAPCGPLAGPPPPADDFHLSPVVDWFEAAIPQQNAKLMADLSGGVEVHLSGPGERTFVVGGDEPTTRISCAAAGFVLALTQRASWAEVAMHVEGDVDQVELLRRVHVF